MVKTKEDLTGKKFGRLTVVNQAYDFISGGRKIAAWNVFCSCNPNKIFRVRQKDLKSGHTKSCGCIVSENAKTVGKINDGKNAKKYNSYNLNGEYGVGYTLNGEEFYFDKEDYEKIKSYCWRIDTRGYVTTNIDKVPVFMHRLILNITDKNIIVDHIYHNKNDNRKSKLRLCTNKENCRNAKIGINNTSGVVGVFYNKNKNKWEATIKVDGKSKYLGRYDKIEDAINCRLEAQNKYFGDFSNKKNGEQRV